MKKTFSLLIFAIMFVVTVTAQSHSVDFTIANQPGNKIILGLVKGDDFLPVDSSYAHPETRKVRFTFSDNAQTGVYRVVLGQTKYAKVMNEAPQSLDFIFNRENMVFKTDFNDPLGKLEIIQSAENKIWYDFRLKNEIIVRELLRLKLKLDDFYKQGDEKNSADVANDFNTLQMERDMLVLETSKKQPELLVSKFIENQRKPLLDGYLNPKERNELFKKEFFRVMDFSDERLIYSSVYTDLVFEYLISYNDAELSAAQREKEYIKAVDIILMNTGKNPKVRKFIIDYLAHGFEVLQLSNAKNYVLKK